MTLLGEVLEPDHGGTWATARTSLTFTADGRSVVIEHGMSCNNDGSEVTADDWRIE